MATGDVEADVMRNVVSTMTVTLLSTHDNCIKKLQDECIHEIMRRDAAHQQQIQDLKAHYEKEMDQQLSSLKNFTLVQSLSQQISDHQKQLEIANDQIRSLKKRLQEQQSKPLLQLKKLAVTVEPDTTPTPVAAPQTTLVPMLPSESPIIIPKSIPEIAPIVDLSKHTELVPVSILSPKLPTKLVAAPEPIPSPKRVPAPEPAPSPKPVTEPITFTKVKINGQIYCVDKKSNADGAFYVYHNVAGVPGGVAGHKTAAGKYLLTKVQ